MLSSIPSEVILLILFSLSEAKEVLPLSCTCKHLNDLINSTPTLFTVVSFSDSSNVLTSRFTRTNTATQSSFFKLIIGLTFCNLKSFNSLKSVSIDFKLPWLEHSQQILDLLSLSTQTLTTLHLTVSQSSQSTVFNLIQQRMQAGQFSNVQTLSLQNISSTFKPTFSNQLISTSTEFHLESLSIYAAEVSVPSLLTHLKHLDLQVLITNHETRLSTLKHLLRSNSNSLQTLKLGHSILEDFNTLTKHPDHHSFPLPKLISLSLSPRTPNLSKCFVQRLDLPLLQHIEGDSGSVAGLHSTSPKTITVWLDGSSSNGNGVGGIKEFQKSIARLSSDGLEELTLRGRPERRGYSKIDGFLKFLASTKKRKASRIQDQGEGVGDSVMRNLKSLTIGEELIYEKKVLLDLVRSSKEKGFGLKSLCVGVGDLNLENMEELRECVRDLRIVGDD